LPAPPTREVSRPEFPFQDPEPVALVESIKSAISLKYYFYWIFRPRDAQEEEM
jgi:hypothetical protein